MFKKTIEEIKDLKEMPHDVNVDVNVKVDQEDVKELQIAVVKTVIGLFAFKAITYIAINAAVRAHYKKEKRSKMS